MLTRGSKNFGKEDIPKENKKIFWSDPQDNTFHDINLLFNGVGGKTLLTCHHGPDLNNQKKQRAKLKKNQREDHQFLKSRNLVQDSKKLDCPASVLIWEIWKFLDFEIRKKTLNG